MTRYRSGHDAAVVAIGILVMVLFASCGILLATVVPSFPGRFILIAGCIGAIGMTISMLTRTYYDLDAEKLEIRCGPGHWKIPLEMIHAVTRERRFAFSAALTRDPLRIEFGEARADVFISPADRDGFLQHLARLSPALERRGEDLTRRVSAL